MSNNTSPRRKRVTKKMLRQRQLGALAVISFLVLLFIILIFKGCSGGGDSKKKPAKEEATTTTTIVTTTAPATTTVPVTTMNPLAAQVELSKREMFIDNIGDMDISYINRYPDGSLEENEVWTSKDESIATVDKYGHVTGVSQGETIITLSFDNNPGIYIEIKVHVADGSGAAPVAPVTPTEGITAESTTPSVVSYTTVAVPSADELSA